MVLCDLFKIPCVSGGLYEQPDWWVENMTLYFKMKFKVQEVERKMAEDKAKRR